MQARELLFEDWDTKKKKVAYLDVLNAVEKYWAQEFKHASAERQSQCRLVRWQQSDKLRELFAVLYGAYPCDLNLKEDFAGGFLRGLRAAEPVIRKEPWMAWRRPDCLADDAVSCELVSAQNSLLTGKLTGNFANSGLQQRFPHLINELIQSLAAKFPTLRNREFSQP